MILVTAATAPVGRSIAEQLVASGQAVRALTRDPAKAGLPAGAEVVAGDLSDPESLAAAFKGVSAVFLLAVVPDFVPAFLIAAKEAGVRRIVFQSSGAVDDDADEQPNEMAAFHHGIERAIRESGLEWTFLRLEVASADALQWAFDVPAQIKAGDVVRGPYAEAAGSPIHPADIAAVAVAALTNDEHAGQIYHLTGPQSLTHSEQVALIGDALGRSLRYEEMDPEAARRADQPLCPGGPAVRDVGEVYRQARPGHRHRAEDHRVPASLGRAVGRRPRRPHAVSCPKLPMVRQYQVQSLLFGSGIAAKWISSKAVITIDAARLGD